MTKEATTTSTTGESDMDCRSKESLFDWNNQASLEMQRGDYKKAAEMYLRILTRLDQTKVSEPSGRRYMRSIIRSRPGVAYVSDDEDEEEEDDEDLAPPLTLLTVPVGADLAAPTMAVDSSTPFALYNQSFITAFREETQVTTDSNGKYLVSALVRFNLGLCVQFKEGIGAQDNLAMLRGAKQSYSSALRFLEHYQDHGNTEDAQFLTLAIYNNLGHLYHKLGDLQEANRCSSHITFLLRRRRTAQFPMNPNDWNFFAQTSIMREQGQALSQSRPTLVV